jgi:NAD(P)H-dependent FMN reductase
MVIAAIGRETSTTNMLGRRVEAFLREQPDIDVDFVTPTDLHLPVNDGTIPWDLPEAKAWQERVSGTDAYIWISPEYHSAMTGGMKNMFDYLNKEPMKNTVVGLCAIAGGAMAALNTLNGMSIVARSLGAWVAPDYCAFSAGEVKEGLKDSSIKRLEKLCLAVIDAAQRLTAPWPELVADHEIALP